MPPEFGGKWGAECFNTKLPLPPLLQREIKKKYIHFFILVNMLNMATIAIERKWVNIYVCIRNKFGSPSPLQLKFIMI